MPVEAYTEHNPKKWGRDAQTPGPVTHGGETP